MKGEKINFEYKGQELTAYPKYSFTQETGQLLLKNEHSADDPLDFELTDISECFDSDTGETVKVTEGIKTAIIMELRRKWHEEDEVVREHDPEFDPKWRIFR